MSTDFSIKPVGAPVATPVAPPVSEAANHAIATELPAPRSVTVVDASVRARVDSGAVYPSLSHHVVLDRAAASIVYQVIDEKTSLVVRQFPEEAILRRRAYFNSLDMNKGEPTRLLATDRKA
ncbi:hypothetical protein [Bradyrhizobium sp.]|uniref:hypothetical protein n=1 Tax=Bradyrhizobium sp. TaxID=376 RepID=UPI000ABAE766|nr:hypothetical protein [Bradyrhizobium sp.]